MAHVWFDKLQSLEAFNPGTLDQLKKDLENRTLIGEYIGSDEHQHLVKYSRVTIIFYAVVDNLSDDDCWPCDKAWDLFDKYDLDKVHCSSLGVYSDFPTLCDSLCKVFKDVAKSEIAKDEEGNVLYFIERKPSGESKVLSLAKLKTLEYRLFRKMREKLRGYYAQERKKGEEARPAS
jgi:ATP-dependent RNA circularization protein (DNA/RNA ligase family)